MQTDQPASPPIASFVRALDDTLLLALYAVCWAVAILAPSTDQIGPHTAGFLAATGGAILVLCIWILRPAFRPGFRLRDFWLVLLVVLTVITATRAPIRHRALFEVFGMLRLAALYLIAMHLCLRRPQPLFAVTLLLMGSAIAVAVRLQPAPTPTPDAWLLGAVTAVSLLSFAPWLAPRKMSAVRRWYGRFVAGTAALVLVLLASGVVPGHANIVDASQRAIPGETRDVISKIVPKSPWLGCGPAQYRPIFQATVPEEFAEQSDALPGIVILTIERGVLGLVALLAFALSALWRFRPGPWAEHHREVLELARPLRWAALFVFVLTLALPAFQGILGQTIAWSLFGMLRAWSSRARPAAVALVTGKPDTATVASPGFAGPSQWTLRQTISLLVVVVGGIALAVTELRPWIAVQYRRRPKGVQLQDAAYLARLESSLAWWPHFPRTHEMVAVHYGSRVNAGVPLSSAEVDAVTRAYRRMIRANPYDPIAHNKLAIWHIKRNRVLGKGLDEAVRAVKRGIAYCPGSFELRYLLARLQGDLGDIEMARVTYQKARQLRPRSRQVLEQLIRLARRVGDRREAEHYEALLQQLEPGASLERIAPFSPNLPPPPPPMPTPMSTAPPTTGTATPPLQIIPEGV